MGGKAGSLPGSDAGCKDCMALCEEVRCSSGNALYADRTKPCAMEQGQRPPAPEAGVPAGAYQMTRVLIEKSRVYIK